MDIDKQIRELIDNINKFNYHYYTLDDPLISDREYDQLYDQLRDLEQTRGYSDDDSPTQKVGGDILDKFVKHTHITRLLSQDKAQSIEDIKSWISRAEKIRTSYNEANEDKLPELEFLMELKFDGLTINLTYDNKQLVNASTRGNGIVGEEILQQVKTIKSIPNKIKEESLMEIQGEGLMPLSRLKEYNEKYEVKLKNARNAAAGAIRNLDPNQTRKRNLIAYFYNIPTNSLNFSTEIEVIDFLKDQGFLVHPYHKLVNNLEDIKKELDIINTLRKEEDILTDGVVIKINDKKTQDVLGYTNKFPRWSIAYKYEAEEFTTTIKEVIWNVGRSGKVTPTAILDPVDFDGVTVKRATLNNYDDIIRKRVRLFSKVFIRRSNDVIPEILGAVDPNQEGSIEIEKPSHCPYCGSELIEGNVHIICPNSISCTPQLLARMEHFASRNAMDIEGLSEKTIAQLMRDLDIKEIDDIYDIKYEDLINLENFGEKKSINLIKAINDSKDVSLEKFVYAIGIPNVGEKSAKDLANKFKSFDNLRNASFDNLIEIDDIGDITARNIIEYFKDENIKGSIDRLLSKGLKINDIEENINSNKLKDLTFVITGTIDGFKRDDIKTLIEKNGGKVTGSVSKNTDVLLAGEKSGSKRSRALELNIEIYENDKLIDFLNELKG